MGESKMSDFIISTDSNCDLPQEFVQENGIRMMKLSYILEGIFYKENEGMPIQEFYEALRGGAMPTTTQVNPAEAKEVFLDIIKDKKNVLHIGFSSGLSGSFGSSVIAANEIMEDNPEVNIKLVDSLCASVGEGLLVYKAVQMRKEGKSLEEVVEALEALKLHICHNFTVDDLHHLHRGGRVSKATAIIGSLVNIKPILHVNNEGKLVSLDKARGRKKSLNSLVDRMEQQVVGYEELNQDMVMIGHGDCMEDAEYVKQRMKDKLGLENVIINYIGSVVGTHAGPGTIVIAFVGNER